MDHTEILVLVGAMVFAVISSFLTGWAFGIRMERIIRAERVAKEK